MILDAMNIPNDVLDNLILIEPDKSWVSQEIISQTIKDVRQSLEVDSIEAEKALKSILLYSNDSTKNTQETYKLIKQLNNGEITFSTTSMIIYSINKFGFDAISDETYISALLIVGILADIKNDLHYHNNLHYKKVLLHVIRMIDAHNNIFRGTPNILKNDDITKLLISACIHDLGHVGSGNIINREYNMAKTEKHSFDLAYPYLKATGIDENILSDILIMLICTDASPFGDPISPINQAKSAYEFHFGMDSEAKIDLCDELLILKDNDRLCLLSVMLHEADIMNSAGVSYDVTKEESVAICKELGEDRAYPEDTLLFLEKICGGGMHSDSARFLADNNLAEIKSKVIADFKNGNKSYM